ncbi:MAG: exonuclease domain-containing protein [Saprospiraceae bacterium]|nr:exonuclease domain-containing protein [Saprospiraceae bacterium]
MSPDLRILTLHRDPVFAQNQFLTFTPKAGLFVNHLILDLEATCWDGAPPNAEKEIIEIGAFKLNAYGEEIGSFNRFVKPIVNPQLSAFCRDLTHIEQAQIDRAEAFPDAIDRFLDWSAYDVDDFLLVTWGKQDLQLLRDDCARHDVHTDWLSPHLDLKASYKDLKRLKKPFGLLKTLDKEGFEFEGQHHRAIDDAYNTAKIFCRYIDEWPF